MANYYSETSFLVECGTKEKAELLVRLMSLDVDNPDDHALIKESGVEEDYPSSGCQASIDSEENWSVWIHNDESIYLDNVISLLEYWTRRTKHPDPVGFEWSGTCSRPLLDAFGGGAVIVYKGNARYISTWYWLARQEQMIEKRRARSKEKKP